MQVSPTNIKCSSTTGTNSFFNRFTKPITSLISSVKERVLSTVNYVLPVNPLTQQRQFTLIPLKAEFFLGASLFREKNIEQSEDLAMAERINNVFGKLATQAPCYEGYEWPFEVRLCDRKDLNAYCLPGGKMVFFKGLVEAIDAHFSNTNREKSITLNLEDGSQVTIDTEYVTADDVLAAVMAHEMTHEMTHGIARHGAFKLLFSLSIEIISRISSFALKFAADTFGREKAKAPTQEELRNKPPEKIQAEPQYNLLGKICLLVKIILDNQFVHNLAISLIKNAHSRKTELQADKHGIELMIKAGYNPKGAIILHQVLSKGHYHQASHLESIAELFSSHPSASTRMITNYRTIQALDA